MYKVKCPKCGNSMKYQPKGRLNSKKKKQCVYCGHGIKVTDHSRSA